MFTFNPQAFMEALPIMGIGMVGIFIVTIVIILVVSCLNRLSGGRKNKQ